jgi:heptosyltransferase III
MPRTIFVVHPGALGDVLLALPAIRALRTWFPTHQLGLVAGAAVGGLLRVCGEIDAVFSLEADALAGLLAGLPWVVGPTVREWLGRCDLAVCWMADPGDRLSSALQRLGVGRVIVRSLASSESEAIHQEDRLMETVRDVAPVARVNERLHLPAAVITEGRARLAALELSTRHPLVVLHPGSGSRHKCVAPALLAAAITRFQANDAVPVLVGGPADDRMVAEVADACASRPVILQHENLLPMAGLLTHADLFVGHDSGLTHLAAALHVPTVALFGPTESRRWAPRGSHVTVLTGEPCRCHGWDEVQACHDKPCLQIQAEELVIVCARLLRQPRVVFPSPPEATCSPCDAPEVMLD